MEEVQVEEGRAAAEALHLNTRVTGGVCKRNTVWFDEERRAGAMVMWKGA
jgi:hypothetical protein